MTRHEHRCCVCGRLLYLTSSTHNAASAYCPDRLCILYPPLATSRSDDPTRASYILAVVESTPTNASALTRALGRRNSYAANIVEQQQKRWTKAV